MTSPASLHPPPASAPAPAAVKAGRGPSSRLRWLGIVSVGVACTVTGAWLSGKLRPDQSTSSSQVKEPDATPSPDDTRPDGAAPDLVKIDQMIREGRFEAALPFCRPGTARLDNTALAALDFRAALCLEGVGDRDKALAAFRAVSGRNPGSPIAAAAELAQARVLLAHRRPAEAPPLFTTLLLRASLPSYADPAMQADAAYLMAFTLVLEVTPDELPCGLKPFALAQPRLDLPVELMLDWVTRDPAESGKEKASPARSLQIRRLGSGSTEVLVTAFTNQEVCTGFLDRVAEQCGLNVQWTPEARTQSGSRTMTVAVEEMPLPALVRALALDADLSWAFEGSTLSVATASQIPARTLSGRRQACARKAIQDALLAYPDHPLASAAYLELGNLEVAAGRIKEGQGVYERLLLDPQQSRIPAELYYNLALTRSRLGDRSQARDAYYWAVDRAPGSELSLLSYLQIGRLHLQDNDPAAAIRPLRRAMSSTSASDIRPVSALLLAAAELSTDSPRAAYSTLSGMGVVSNKEPYRRAAALLDALARYRTQPDPRKATREAGDLLDALLNYREEAALGQVGVLLAGRAYRDLGLPNDMAALYGRSSKEIHSPLLLEMTADLAEYHFQAGQWKQARQEFTELAAGGNRRSEQAERRLADLDLIDRRPDDCLKRCRSLLKANPKLANSGLLAVMGRAYAQKGDDVRAARCYAGEVPD